MPERHTELFEVDVGQFRQDIGVDFTRAKKASYCPRPRPLSQPPTSMAAPRGLERIIVRLKRPVQRRPLEERVGSR